MDKILVVDDEADFRDFMSSILNDNGYHATAVEDGMDIVSKISKCDPCLVLLDCNLPGKSGFEVVKDIRQSEGYKALPVIMVTGRGEEADKVAALEAGADDYVVKPLSPKELMARIGAVLRRSQDSGSEEDKIESGELAIDFRSHQVTVQGNEISLTLTEFKILSELLKSIGSVLSRDKLRQTALGNLNVTDRTIDVHIASLRKKLGPCAERFHTVRGVGYRFDTP